MNWKGNASLKQQTVEKQLTALLSYAASFGTSLFLRQTVWGMLALKHGLVFVEIDWLIHGDGPVQKHVHQRHEEQPTLGLPLTDTNFAHLPFPLHQSLGVVFQDLTHSGKTFMRSSIDYEPHLSLAHDMGRISPGAVYLALEPHPFSRVLEVIHHNNTDVAT
ncbi:hypothetical protein WG66_006499 [Moniliophthora roreri]|nr:hypothetical protein WG66_006499 [Moniliophthora roreri]